MAIARRPVLYVGGGVLKAGAAAVLTQLAELTGAPVVTTLMARGAFPDSHHLHMGMPGMHGSVGAVFALQRADLVVALGARFDDRVTGKLDGFAPGAAIIHADIDPAEIGKNRAVDVPIVGDARYVIAELIGAITTEHRAGNRGDLRDWWAQLDDIRTRYPARMGGAGRRRARPTARDLPIGRSRRDRRDLRGRRGPAPDVGIAVHHL